jgi:hypothetical protein
MTFAGRLAEIRERVHAAKLDVVIALHHGAHFSEKPDPVKVLTGFKALGPVAALLLSAVRSDSRWTSKSC